MVTGPGWCYMELCLVCLLRLVTLISQDVTWTCKKLDEAVQGYAGLAPSLHRTYQSAESVNTWNSARASNWLHYLLPSRSCAIL